MASSKNTASGLLGVIFIHILYVSCSLRFDLYPVYIKHLPFFICLPPFTHRSLSLSTSFLRSRSILGSFPINLHTFLFWKTYVYISTLSYPYVMFVYYAYHLSICLLCTTFNVPMSILLLSGLFYVLLSSLWASEGTVSICLLLLSFSLSFSCFHCLFYSRSSFLSPVSNSDSLHPSWGPIFGHIHWMSWPKNGSLYEILDSRLLYRYIYIFIVCTNI